MSDRPTSQDHNAVAPATTDAATVPSTASIPIEPPAAISSPTIAQPSSTPEAEALLEIIRRGLAPDADPAARANALDVCGRIVQAFGGLVPAPPVTPAPVAAIALAPTPPLPFTMPQGFAPPAPASPLAAAVGMLRNLPPEQLFDLAIQRLRAVLPQGTTVTESKGIQFQLVPVTSPGGKP